MAESTPTTGRSGQATRVMWRVISFSSVDSMRGSKPGMVCSCVPHVTTRPK